MTQRYQKPQYPSQWRHPEAQGDSWGEVDSVQELETQPVAPARRWITTKRLDLRLGMGYKGKNLCGMLCRFSTHIPHLPWPVAGSSLDVVPGELDIQSFRPRVKINYDLVSKTDQQDCALARDQLVGPARW